MNDKIRAQHLARKAMLYVRQSSAYQVSHNLESQKLQYAMQDRLHQLGWNEVATHLASIMDATFDASLWRQTHMAKNLYRLC